jgi:HEXXH motif-containing protein
MTEGMQRSLHRAARLLSRVGSLEAVISDRVSQIVPLLAEPDYDVSHSEPRWDALIFVTIPEGDDNRPALRSLENIVHEAMHIQLTRLEGERPLIADEAATMPSPWRDEPRHLRGVLHGAYVFECILKCFARLAADRSLDKAGQQYISARTVQIGDELATIDLQRLVTGMTSEGRRFVEALLTAA